MKEAPQNNILQFPSSRRAEEVRRSHERDALATLGYPTANDFIFNESTGDAYELARESWQKFLKVNPQFADYVSGLEALSQIDITVEDLFARLKEFQDCKSLEDQLDLIDVYPDLVPYLNAWMEDKA